MAIKAIFFDFWGTLAENGVRSPIKQVKYILRLNDMDFSEYVIKFERVFMTKKLESLQAGFEDVLKEFDLSVSDFVVEKMIGLWNKNAILAQLDEEAPKVLEDLKKDYKLILISNTDPFSITSVLDKHDLRKYFDIISLSCDTGLLKSDKESFENILKELKLEKDEVVMVGDSIESDVKSAENVGIRAILVDKRDSREYDDKITSLSELKEKLQ